MGRIPLLLVLLVLAGLVNPSLRAAAEPYARPYVDRALSPVYGWQARYRVKEIARGLQELAARGHPLPEPRAFPQFLRDFYRGDTPELDPWGQPLLLRSQPGGVQVISVGADGKFGTTDDIRSPVVQQRRR